MEAHEFTMRSFAFLDEAGAKAAIKSSVSDVEAFLNEFRQIGFGYEKHDHSVRNPMVKMAKSLQEAEDRRASPKKKVQICL
ncbi:MAG: hypothetical protein GKR94_17095 [Gammaproteobacteria bacterium]|nr:hypothetical protein [Gammaproteobacteria bacterium]